MLGQQYWITFRKMLLTIPIPDWDCNFYKIFRISKLRNNLRSFIFNFSAQTLYHNAMIAHFVQNHEPTCQQCEFGNLRPRETISHIFWDCPKIIKILLDLNIIILNGTLSHEELKSVIFLGCNNPLTFNVENPSRMILTNCET